MLKKKVVTLNSFVGSILEILRPLAGIGPRRKHNKIGDVIVRSGDEMFLPEIM